MTWSRRTIGHHASSRGLMPPTSASLGRVTHSSVEPLLCPPPPQIPLVLMHQELRLRRASESRMLLELIVHVVAIGGPPVRHGPTAETL